MIILAQENHLSSIMALMSLFSKQMTESWSVDSIKVAILNNEVYIVVEENKVAAFMLGRWYGNDAEIELIAVLPEYQRKGNATTLCSNFQLLAKTGGALHCFLEVRRENTEAIAFYQAQGFSHSRIRKSYYRDGEDALVMSRQL